jgi:alkaline phosphatase D
LALGAMLVAASARAADAPKAVVLTHGVASGDVTATSAVVWGRCDGPAALRVRLRAADGAERSAEALGAADHDFTAKVRFDALAPDTAYHYEAACARDGAPQTGPAVSGEVRTAPASDTARAVRFAWSGDVGGQNVCRDKGEGYTVFDRVGEQHPEFFLGLGDMVYADDPCRPVGRYRNAQVPGPPASLDLAGFWSHWRYNWEDPHLRRLLASTPYYGVWDDHEIANDAGPMDDESPRAPGRHLLPLALHAYVDYQPMTVGDDHRLYRSIRWGKHVELFLLDTRQYRDSRNAIDDPAHPKTMLGAAQRQWFLDAVERSDATWKIVVSSVPLSIPTGSYKGARDGWANGDDRTGFENEALAILRSLHEHKVRNQLWITTDVHFTTGFRYTPFADDPGFVVYEITTGPLNAGVLPRYDLDATLHPERLFLFGPPDPLKVASYDEAKHWFNFGVVDVAADGALVVTIVTAKGEKVQKLGLPVAP